MIEPGLAHYLAACLTVPLLIPQVLILLPNWRFSRRVMCLLALGMELVIVLSAWIVYILLGPTLPAVWLMGTVPPVVCVVAFVLCYNLRDGRLLFIMATLGLEISICDAITSFFASRAEPLWLAIKIVFSLLVCALSWWFRYGALLEMLESNQIHWGQTSIIPTSLCASLTGLYLSSGQPDRRNTAPIPTVVLCCVSVIIYIALYRFQQATLEQANARQYQAVLQSEVNALQRQSEQAESAVQNVRTLQHDIRHYTRLMRGCLETGNMEAARKILDALDRNIEALPALTSLEGYTGNHIIDTVLTQCAARCHQLGIAFEAQLLLPHDLQVEMTELAVVISNALENAIHAANGEPGDKRIVAIQSARRGERLFLLISNTFSGELHLNGKTGLPQTEQEGHGYGTYSISNFARKYNCLLDYRVRDGMFYLRLLI